MHRALALFALFAALFVPKLAYAYCTYSYDPWSQVACNDPSGDPPYLDQVTCEGLLYVALSNPADGLKAIPVYANFDETYLLHEDADSNPVWAHRSLSKTGLTEAEIENQLKAAIARWNQAASGYPNLFYAGHATDVPDNDISNNQIGIVVEAGTCFDGSGGIAMAGTAKPSWGPGGTGAYRGFLRLDPVLHGVAGVKDGRCATLTKKAPWLKSWGAWPTAVWTESLRPEEGTNQVSIQATLVHELGHTLGLLHNKFSGSSAPDNCGLGPHGVDTWGVMRPDNPYTDPYPRRDEIEALRDLHAANLPTSWSVPQWISQLGFPDTSTEDAEILDLTTSVLPTLATSSRHIMNYWSAIGFADPDGLVRVRTISHSSLDAVANDNDIPFDAEEGRTFAPVGVAMAVRGNTAKGSIPDQVFAAWTVDDPLQESLQTRWALRDLTTDVWQVFGPDPFAPHDIPIEQIRVHPAIGAAYDPVQDDFLVATLSTEHQIVVTRVTHTGTALPSIRLMAAPGIAAAPVSAIGSPVCMDTNTPGESRCLFPIATDQGSVVGVYEMLRTNIGLGPVSRWYSNTAACPNDPSCADDTGYGFVAISWNDARQEGHLSYTDESGAVKWKLVTLDPVTQDVLFADSAVDTYGSDRTAPALLAQGPGDVVDALIDGWPVCPWWNATSGGVGHIGYPGALDYTHVARATCLPTCGDGFVDTPPWGTEECDGDAGSATCAHFGYDAGEVTCTAGCDLDTSACFDEPPEDPMDDLGDCLLVQDCNDYGVDGCFPDGPGSFGTAEVTSSVFDQSPGLYCPDVGGVDEIESICGLTMQASEPTPTCIDCPPVGQGGADYGCPCNVDADCAATGLAADGSTVSLECYAGIDDGWSAPGRCMPTLTLQPGFTSPEVVEFERTRWLCKQNCDAISESHVCQFRQEGSAPFTYAVCVEEDGCDDGTGFGLPGGYCEYETFGSCDPNSGTCLTQCDGAGSPGCLALGYPANYECTDWLTYNACVPIECSEFPFATGIDYSLCQSLLGFELSPE